MDVKKNHFYSAQGKSYMITKNQIFGINDQLVSLHNENCLPVSKNHDQSQSVKNYFLCLKKHSDSYYLTDL